VVFVGGRSGLTQDCTVGEARDAVDLRLTGVQEQLVEAVVATGTPTAVCVISGRVHDLSAIAVLEPAPALVWAGVPGEEGGHALADVLLGRRDPGGRLPVTLPRATGQVPVFAGHRAGGGQSLFYGDYTDSPASPLFPFGHGLSYTTFEYRGLDLQAATTRDPVLVRVTVANTGVRPGTEVVQLYARDEIASVARPDRLLVGFHRLQFEPGEVRVVTFTVHPSRLAFYDPSMRFVTEPGEFTFAVARSAAAVERSATVTLTGDVAEYRQREIVATAVDLA
jgi:beta-glucosidase